MTVRQFRVVGMHCPACEFLVADEVGRDPGVAAARARLADRTLTVELADDPGEADLKGRWNRLLDPLGYRLFLESEDPARITRRETVQGLGLGLAVLSVFAALEALGLVNLVTLETLEPSGAFVLGLLASVSSCFALVGGLLVSFTAAVGRRSPAAVGPGLAAFHASRLVTFVVGGGLLGLAGQGLAGGWELQRILLTLAALVMVGLGLSLVGLRFGSFRPPRTSVVRAQSWARWGTAGGGLLLGAGTFILPCGFTQTVQFQALASGSPLAGALLTGAFALGTLPVLASVSWILQKGLSGARRAVLLKAGGTLVVGLGLVQLWGAAHLWGWRL